MFPNSVRTQASIVIVLTLAIIIGNPNEDTTIPIVINTAKSILALPDPEYSLYRFTSMVGNGANKQHTTTINGHQEFDFGNAQANMTNVIPIDPANAKVINAFNPAIVDGE